MPYRFVYVGLVALVVAVVALGVALAPEGESSTLPAPVEGVSPAPNHSVLRQAPVEVDLETGYRAAIWVDGFRVPDSEVTYVPATGVHRWAPSPTGVYLDEWVPGEHTVRIAWDRVAGLPDVGEFQWTFRVQ